MELLFNISIIIHAFLGGLGLLAGITNLFSTKGNNFHRKVGKIFSISMIGSASVAFYIALLPGHKNLFLFMISILTIYMILAGNRALTFKNRAKKHPTLYDKGLSMVMLTGSVIMIAMGIYNMLFNSGFSILFIIFGIFGLLMSLDDFRFLNTYQSDKKLWLTNHIGRIVGGVIASVTAFFIAGLNFQSIFAWISPSIIGTLYIVYWIRNIKKNGKAASILNRI